MQSFGISLYTILEIPMIFRYLLADALIGAFNILISAKLEQKKFRASTSTPAKIINGATNATYIFIHTLKSSFVLILLITMATAAVELIATVTAEDAMLFIKKKLLIFIII